MKQQRWITFLVFALLMVYYVLVLSNKITINGGELGLLLKEGELLVTEGQILNSNHFTYTNPDHPIINHHWASAAIFYLVQRIFDFGGLHFFALLIQLFSLGILLRYLLRRWAEHWQWWGVVGLLVVPLYGLHSIIEPAIFSMLFVPLFLLAIWRFIEGDLPSKYLWGLPIMQLFWVNLDSSFFLGWLVVAAGLLQAIANAPEKNWLSPKVRKLSLILGLCLLATLLNPQHIYGALSPLFWLFEERSYTAADWTNVISIYLVTKSHTLLYVIIMALAGIYSFAKVVRNEDFKKQRVFLGLTLSVLIAWSLTSSLHIVFLGPAALLALGLGGIVFSKKHRGLQIWIHHWSPAMVFYFIVPLFFVARFYAPVQGQFGLGMQEGAMKAGKFLAKSGLKGPIFHNLGSAGYLAYHIGDKEKLYVLNQKGSHPNSFFTQEYFPNIHKVLNWRRLEEKYKFNIIYFKLQGENNENLVFLGNRLGEKDENGIQKWALIYHEEEQNAIMLRRTPENAKFIELNEFQLNLTN